MPTRPAARRKAAAPGHVQALALLKAVTAMPGRHLHHGDVAPPGGYAQGFAPSMRNFLMYLAQPLRRCDRQRALPQTSNSTDVHANRRETSHL